MNDYAEFLATKSLAPVATGFDCEAVSESLYPFQRDLVRWALRIGRAAIFADTGLGKSRMQLEWAKHVAAHTGGRVLILAPLAVAAQTVREGNEIGVKVKLCRDGDEVEDGISITNYDRLHRFETSQFHGVVLDESSIIKHHEAKTLGLLIEAFRGTRYKLCATATPAPNDFSELGTHAEFLGVSSRQEMLSEFFIHDAADTGEWRLKGHARKVFWQWVSAWGALVRRPSDLGYADEGYDLPPLNVRHHQIASSTETVRRMGLLFAEQARDLVERRNARKASASERVRQVAELVNASKDQWLVWGDLNVETQGVAALVEDAVEVAGPDAPEVKEKALIDFAEGRIRVLVSKLSIAGFGMNFQRCNHMAFIGVSDSWEQYYQGVRRCYRFGQMRPVHVHIFASDAEGSVIDNLARKEADAKKMADELSAETRDALQASVLRKFNRHNPYVVNKPLAVPSWLRSVPNV
jgi:superfamily II DNA or RNA helicase